MDVLSVKYCSKHLAQGGKKYANFISEAFKPYLKQYDEKKSRTDLVFFDGSSNVQKAGKIIAASYPWIIALHSSEQVLYLFYPTLKNYQLSGQYNVTPINIHW